MTTSVNALDLLHDPAFGDAAALQRLLASRYSCRAYLSNPVPRALIDKILGISQKTASWCNSQPWKVIVTTGAGTDRFRDALLRDIEKDPPLPDIAFPREYRGVYLERRRECGFQLYHSVGVARGDREAAAIQGKENFRLFGAPHVAIITTDEALGTYGAIDCGAYVANFTLAARSFGVASIAQAALASRSRFLKQYFGLGEDRLVVCGISFGYEDPVHRANRFRTRRAPLEQVVTVVEE
jgi:nitroreductase